MTIRFPFLLPAVIAAAVPIVAFAQTVADETPVPETSLAVPGGRLFGAPTPQDAAVRSAFARVNGEVITGTDIDHRLALVVAANGGEVPAEERERLRAQVLRNLIDETLQIQAARENDITIADAEVEETFQRVVTQNFKRDPKTVDAYLRSLGASSATLKRQIRGELAWNRLLRRNVQPFVEVSDEEVDAVVKRLEADKGSDQYRVGEIYLSATPENAAQVNENARKILERVRAGGSFVAYARQFSEASTAAVGGDLGWVPLAQLPEQLSSVVSQMQVGQVVGPIEAPGGVSILYLIDKRQVLGSDARDAVLTLKQLSISFPAGTSEAAATPRLNAFAKTMQGIDGCGAAEAAAKSVGADIVTRDNIAMRELPPILQNALGQMQVGQATPPYGSLEEGVRSFVLCGRDMPKVASAPSPDRIRDQMLDDKVGKRAQTYLRDLRRDAVIEYN